ncbi:hypothetical protein T07_1060 [Trichinella nelsoni]|uniref:Uncharacterized protein n=1 Tax=Trichinella nelsoni TaxID=6336 RepID=A0A0V0RNN8_9BILA|nr:hypothetical protein T07_1060 [Trichinella nelsoni]
MECIGARLFLVGPFLLVSPCVHGTTHPGPVESAPDSCQHPPLNQDFVSEGSRHQRLLSPLLGRDAAAMSPDQAIFLHLAAPLLLQHMHLDLWVRLLGSTQLVFKALRHVFTSEFGSLDGACTPFYQPSTLCTAGPR